MFDSVEVLVDESDRRRALATDLEDDDETLESAHIVFNRALLTLFLASVELLEVTNF